MRKVHPGAKISSLISRVVKHIKSYSFGRDFSNPSLIKSFRLYRSSLLSSEHCIPFQLSTVKEISYCLAIVQWLVPEVKSGIIRQVAMGDALRVITVIFGPNFIRACSTFFVQNSNILTFLYSQ